jgi:hypothetical protein
MLSAGGVSTVFAQTVALGTVEDFAVLAATAVTSTGATVLDGDLGLSPNGASSITGFPPGVVNGVTHAADGVALQAQNDLVGVYNNLAGRACATTIAGDLGGQTLVPGVYCASSTVGLTGTLTLDAQGDPSASFIFQIGSTLTTASAAQVLMINGAQDCNVFWQVGSSATLGTSTRLVGSIVALASATLNTGASVSGRVLARTGAVTLDGSAVSVCTLQGQPVAPSLSKAFLPDRIAAGGGSVLTVSLANPSASVSTLTAPLLDGLPAGVVIAALPNLSTSCGGSGVLLAMPGGSSLSLPAGRTIPALGQCSFSVNVSAANAGTYLNTLPIGALQTSTGFNPAIANATLVVGALVPTSVRSIPSGSPLTLWLLAAAVMLSAFWSKLRSGA